MAPEKFIFLGQCMCNQVSELNTVMSLLPSRTKGIYAFQGSSLSRRIRDKLSDHLEIGSWIKLPWYHISVLHNLKSRNADD